MEAPKQHRLQEIYRRLTQAPAAGTFDEMRAQLADVINAVEDQLTGIPYDPANWRNDGRIYPVYDDNVFDVAGHPRVTLLRARKNLVYIGDNGSAEIRDASGDVTFRKPGRDGLGVWELD
ncbi:MAG TPA: hypothetical protein VGC13_21570 [Longimicrobium sp.]|jgi:hypothetical protein|uniref:hypothetical protein n=1 Tax=Longimicrobium sp. TaxID=2029185 RepID=UPI002EDA5D86